MTPELTDPTQEALESDTFPWPEHGFTCFHCGEGRAVGINLTENSWADPNHKGNRIRPRLRCIGCGTKGGITAWGPWCFPCNVKRMSHLCGVFDQIAAALEKIDAR